MWQILPHCSKPPAPHDDGTSPFAGASSEVLRPAHKLPMHAPHRPRRPTVCLQSPLLHSSGSRHHCMVVVAAPPLRHPGHATSTPPRAAPPCQWANGPRPLPTPNESRNARRARPDFGAVLTCADPGRTGCACPALSSLVPTRLTRCRSTNARLSCYSPLLVPSPFQFFAFGWPPPA